MSYDLIVFDPEAAPRQRDAFLDWYTRQMDLLDDQPRHTSPATSANLSAWLADMRRDFPDMNGPDARGWADGDESSRLTGYSVGQSMIYADFRWSEAQSAYATVRACAVQHDVGFFNVSASDGEIWFPPKGPRPDTTAIPGLRLSLAGQEPFPSPSIALIEAAVDWLEPSGGPGFLILDRVDAEDYAQVAGGKDTCTAEWRDYSKKGFRHWVAGVPNRDAQTNVTIAGNGTLISVRANERLSNENAISVLRAFARGNSRPQDFVWRETTSTFDGAAAVSKPWWQFWR